jgi:ATP-binding cassette, subfamily B, bacterial
VSIGQASMSFAGAAAAGTERATGRQAFGLLWRSSRRLAVAVLAWLVAGALFPPLVVGALGAVVGDVPAAIRDGMGSTSGHRLIAALIIAAVIYALSLVLDPVGNALGTAARSRITGELQARLLAAVSTPVGVGHLEDAAVLDRLARAEGTLTGFFPGDAPVTWVGQLASRLSGVIGCILIAIVNWWLGLLLLVMWLSVRWVMLAAVVRQATELRGQTTAMRRAWYFIGVGSKARDAKEVRVFGLGQFVADRFRHHYLTAMATGAAGLKVLHRRAAACFAVVLATYGIALGWLAVATRYHHLGVRGVAIVLPMLAMTMSVGNVSFDDVTLTWALAGLPDVDRLESELARTGAELSGHRPVGDLPRNAVRLEAVHFRYPTSADDVLAGVDLELRAGTSTAIVGVNGAGKSTLVSLLSRLRDPTAGRITVDDIDVREFDPASWQRRVAIMPQEPAQYPVSAYDNVAFGAIEARADREGVEAAATMAGFAEVVERLPQGWQTVLAKELPGGTSLSGGEWQRLALARALFATRHGARLLVLDEPTAALDVRREAQFYAKFLEITAGLTTVVISHRFATVRRADVIAVLDGGRITERGSHAELVAADGAYARMYAVQAARFGAS